LCQSANADAATQADKKIVAKAGIKHTVEATTNDTEGTSKVEEPGAESKRAFESADYGASQLHELSQVFYFICVLLLCCYVLSNIRACVLLYSRKVFSTGKHLSF
jgi:hypothetical protein